MSAATLPTTVPTTTTSDADEWHLLCCDPDLARCGIDLRGEWDEGDEGDRPDCRMCLIVEAEGWPCPVPTCPLREVSA